MLRRLAVLLSLFFCAAFLPHGSGTTGNALQQLLATMPADSWQQLNASTGNGSPLNLLSTLVDPAGGTGYTMCNYDGLPPTTCPGGSGSGDLWSTNAAVAANAGASGAKPVSNRVMIGDYSSPAIRPTDGEVCSLDSGGHDGVMFTSVVCFDTPAAIAALVAAGGYGHTPAGTWSLRIKPAHALAGFDPRPANNVQVEQATCAASWSNSSTTISISTCTDQYGNTGNGSGLAGSIGKISGGTPGSWLQNGDTTCFPAGTYVASVVLPNLTMSATSTCADSATLHFNPTAWSTVNNDGILQPVGCHMYWTNQWIGGNKWTNGGAYGCAMWPNSALDGYPGGIAIFDDSTNGYVYPLGGLVQNNLKAFTLESSGSNGDAYDRWGGCVWAPAAQILYKWCSPTDAATAPTTVANAGGVIGTFGTLLYAVGIMMPDPVNPGGTMWFENYNGSCSSSFTEQNHTRHPSVGSWPNPATYGCFCAWLDINGTPRAITAQYGPGVNANPLAGLAGWAWHPGIQKPIAYAGAMTVYQVTTSNDPYGTPWVVSTLGTGAGGSSPAGGPTTPAGGGSFPNIAALDGYNAEIVFAVDSSATQIWLHKD
jgi:hypothetical protein